ncbi:hypothetical protein ALC57_17289 [Trachymyrmex cornetzi]|uniref:Uncharacterized protein n=1 Tax=Trachymyrmex cornetzi TaxID=471704 RepID=A0A195DCX2_9HYME|nr:hypothetical protein ALC57_17289 [Trachymyrmex cornetzi]
MLVEVVWREGKWNESMKEMKGRIREVLGNIEKERGKERKGMGWWGRECREKERVRRILRKVYYEYTAFCTLFTISRNEIFHHVTQIEIEILLDDRIKQKKNDQSKGKMTIEGSNNTSMSGTLRRKVTLALTSIPRGGSRINRNHCVSVMAFASTTTTCASDRDATATTERDRSDPYRGRFPRSVVNVKPNHRGRYRKERRIYRLTRDFVVSPNPV